MPARGLPDMTFPVPIYGLALLFTAGTHLPANTTSKPGGFTFGLGADLQFSRSWSVQTEAFLLVPDNLMGPARNKQPGFYTAGKYRAFLSDKVYAYVLMGPGYAAHPSLAVDTVQLVTEGGLGTTGYDGWGASLGWRHISSGQVGNGNRGVDYIALSLRYELGDR